MVCTATTPQAATASQTCGAGVGQENTPPSSPPATVRGNMEMREEMPEARQRQGSFKEGGGVHPEGTLGYVTCALAATAQSAERKWARQWPIRP